MLYVFIVNPVAGNGRLQKVLVPQIHAVLEKFCLAGEIYFTKGVGDARTFVRMYPHQDVCFFCLGGDGTLNEIAHGVMERGSGIVGLVPCGTGNDFVRIFSDTAAFLDLERQVQGSCQEIDILQVNDGYSLNLCNLGLDAQTAALMPRYKAYLPGSLAYHLALLRRVLAPLGEKMRITLDTGEVFDGTYLLVSFANGKAYGGGYFAAPRADPDDGMLECCLVKVMSRRKFAALVKRYKAGKHLDDPAFSPVLTYRRCRRILLELPAAASFCNDGEIRLETKVEIAVRAKALRLMIPQGVSLCGS